MKGKETRKPKKTIPHHMLEKMLEEKDQKRKGKR